MVVVFGEGGGGVGWVGSLITFFPPSIPIRGEGGDECGDWDGMR